MTERLFHVALLPEWGSACTERLWALASLAEEGFVCLSLRGQLRGTLARHFSGCPSAMLLEVNPAGLGDDLRTELARDGELFPHLYRAIAREEFLGYWELHLGYGELWQLPTLGEVSTRDLPPSNPLMK